MKNIVLSGSMQVKEEILKIAKMLQNYDVNVLLPTECMEGKPKIEASKAHFNRIIDKNNEIVLVINATKNGISNYIGANTFAEIAFGFHFNKEIYLLYDIYEPYKDELEGWNVIPLKGNLDKLIKEKSLIRK